MKNYYNILGVSQDATLEEITEAYKNISETLRTSKEIDAYNVLSNSELKKEYDEKLKAHNEKKEKRSEFFKKNKVTVYSCAVLGAAVLIGFPLGIAACNKGKDKEDTKVEASITPTAVPTAKPTVTVAPTATPAPTAKPTSKPTVTVAPTATLAPTPTPIVAENVEALDSANIDEVAKQLTESYKEKGLVVNAEDVKSALLVANIENIDKDELDTILANTTIGNEISKANNFAVALTTHNINAICNNETKSFVESSKLMYGESDKEIISYLDDTTMSIVNSKSLTEKQYDSSLERVSNFYLELGSLDINGEKYSYNSLSTGAKYVSEMCVWPNAAVAYTINRHSDDKSYARIAATQNVANDGIRYMTDLSICAQAKQLTK